ncbi:N-acetylmuramoyl-L-alanine amidase [Streptomyces sp. NPDC008313]|uniref:N-acetylmuramoyl-L-alanine amidase n=1 Tax=Streptomyces sp. NPDC008313 TaxID=3364826 RepID=UPI0036E6C071
MGRFLASSIGVTCATALALPLTLPVSAAAASVTSAAGLVRPARPPAAAAPAVPGSTQSLPLGPLPSDRAVGSASTARGLTARNVQPFSLVGVIWDDPGTELRGRVQVRTRAAGTGHWSGWQDVETHNHDHAADPGTEEGASGAVRGSTAPLWVGASDGVEARVQADSGAIAGPDTGDAGGAAGASALPEGLHLELVDPGEEPAPADAPTGRPAGGAQAEGARSDGVRAEGAAPGGVRAQGAAPGGVRAEPPASDTLTASDTLASDGLTPEGLTAGELASDGLTPEGLAADGLTSEGLADGALAAATEAASRANAGLAPLGATEIPALSREETERELLATAPEGEQRAKPYVGPRPGIVTRRGWGADEGIRKGGFAYTKTVRAAFVHHTATGNNYSCSQAPSVIRGIYRYHVRSSGWRDIGYNFLVDKCGTIYEGRAGGVAKPVLGAHTLGFNTNSMGIAVIGSYGSKKPSAASVQAIARLTAWKLGLFGANPRGKTYLTSGGGNLYRKGKKVRLNVISGHRDGFATACPGRRLYSKLGTARSDAARYQGR